MWLIVWTQHYPYLLYRAGLSEFHGDFSKVGEYESSEPTSLATTSTMEGEHTLSPGAGEDGGEGLGEVSFHGTPLSVYCEVSPAL